MALFKNIFSRSLNNPAVPLSAAGFLAWAFGGQPTAAGELVTAASALQNVDVFACVRVLSDGVASLPVRVYQRTDNGNKVEMVNNPIASLLTTAPNDEMVPYTFIVSLIAGLMSDGNCYAEIQRSTDGRAIGLWPLHPALTTPQRDPQTNTIYFETTDTPGNKTRRIAAADMLHVPYISLTGDKGLSPIGLAREAIGLNIAAEKFGSRYFGNNAVPGGILSNSSADSSAMSDEQKQLLRTSWDQAQAGKNQHRTAVLLGDWKYTPISISPQDSQFLQLRQFSRTQIAALFNVPPSKIGDLTKQSKASAEQENLSFVTDTLRPLCVRLEQQFRAKLFPGQPEIIIEFDFSERLRTDFASTLTAISQGRQWGILTANDGRKMLDLDPLAGPENDLTLVAVNMQNSAWLLDTESIQDQPVNAAPAKTPAQNAQRSLMDRVGSVYALIFRDAMGRAIQRPVEKRAESITTIFEPVIRSLAIATGADDKHVAQVFSGLSSRSTKWTNADEDGRTEFHRVVRSLHISAMRDRAAKLASEEVTPLALPQPTYKDTDADDDEN